MDASHDSDSNSPEAAKARAAFLRRRFGSFFLIAGFIWLLCVFDIAAAAHTHAWGLLVLGCFGLAMGTYVLIFGARAWVRFRVSDPGATKFDRDWVLQAVHENRVLADEERPAAQETARKLLWNRRRRASLVFWSALAIVIAVHNLLTRHHSDVGAAANVLLIVCAIFNQWGHVPQARLRRWMAANHLD